MAVEAQSPRELELQRKQAEADAQNKERSGIGLRVRVGQTRGKNPMVITWEAFDESIPDSLPTTVEKFMEVTSVKEEKDMVSLLIAGFNDQAYTSASDPLAEYVNPSWPADAQAQFRLVVRNYSRGAQVSIESAVELIKPGFDKQFAK